MSSPLLTTKLYVPPPRPGLVHRPRLIERLNEGLYRKLTLISAPAGFGKTTLLSEWIANGCADSQFAWLSLDEGDNDLVRFWTYLIAALQTVRADLGKTALAMLGSAGLANAEASLPVEALLTGLINEMAEDPAPFVLVLDDFHAIASQQVHRGLIFLLDRLPPQMHVVVSGRSDPPWPLARWRARGEMTELRLDDLRFTANEIAEFLNQVMGLALSADDLATLGSRTEGWIAGLQMAALALQARVSTQGWQDVAGFIRAFTGSDRHVLDYLAEEVLQRQPASVQRFLLQTSILERLCGPLCDAVMGNQRVSESANQPADERVGFADLNGQAMLEWLERANLFIVPLDNERQWYRYHGLFADLLRKCLQQAYPDLVPTLHGRASEWYEQSGLMAPAVEHALLAGDFEQAAYLIDGLAEALWGHGEQTTLLGWLEALPDEEVTSRPRLCAFHALVLLAGGRFDAAERRLRVAERALGSTTGEALTELQGMVATVRALAAYFQGDVPAIIRFSRQALEALPEEDVTWRSSAATNLGDALRWSGDIAAANRAYEEAIRVGQMAGDPFLVMLAGVKQVFVQVAQGRLQRALETCRQLLHILDENGLSEAPMAASVYAIWGDTLRERNELGEASRYVRKACELSERGNMVGILGLSHLFWLKVLLAKNDTAGIEETMQRLQRLVHQSSVPVWISSGLAAWEAWMWVAQGQLKAAAQLLQERGVGVDDDISYPRGAEYLALARLLTAQGEFEQAARLLERMFQQAQTGGQEAWMIETSILRALAFQAQGDLEQAMISLERALSLAELEGFARIFVDEGEPMRLLLSRLIADRRLPAAAYARKLLAALDLHPPSSTLLEPLSERELEVLRLLAAGLSNPEIAQELVVANSTVRSHVKSIYGKLGVHNRTQAVVRAQALGLL